MKILKKEAPGLILICFSITMTYVILYELVLTRFPSCCEFAYKLGLFTSRLSYSIIAASIFYYFSQYIPVFLPKQERKIKILFNIYQRSLTIDFIVSELKFNMGINNNEFLIVKDFDNLIKTINPDKPIAEFENWHQFLYHLKSRLLEVIRSIVIYNDYLSKDFLQELMIIERILFSPYTFVGYKTLSVQDLSYAKIDLHELLVHNKHLQELRESEFKKYEKLFNLDGAEYRKKYYEKKL